MTCCGGNGISMRELHGLQVDSHRTILFCLSRNRVVAHGLRKVLSGASPGITPPCIVELYVAEVKLRGAAVGPRLGMFAQSEAEEEPNLNKVCSAFGLF